MVLWRRPANISSKTFQKSNGTSSSRAISTGIFARNWMSQVIRPESSIPDADRLTQSSLILQFTFQHLNLSLDLTCNFRHDKFANVVPGSPLKAQRRMGINFFLSRRMSDERTYCWN